MSIRLATSKPLVCVRGNGALLRRMRVACANDNAVLAPADIALRAALRHFAEHGLAAAEHAMRQAQDAAARGDVCGYGWWREICHTLDRRLAGKLDRTMRQGKSAAPV